MIKESECKSLKLCSPLDATPAYYPNYCMSVPRERLPGKFLTERYLMNVLKRTKVCDDKC